MRTIWIIIIVALFFPLEISSEESKIVNILRKAHVSSFDFGLFKMEVKLRNYFQDNPWHKYDHVSVHYFSRGVLKGLEEITVFAKLHGKFSADRCIEVSKEIKNLFGYYGVGDRSHVYIYFDTGFLDTYDMASKIDDLVNITVSIERFDCISPLMSKDYEIVDRFNRKK